MLKYFRRLRHSLISKVILTAGITLFLFVSFWSYFNIRYHDTRTMEAVVSEIDRLSTTIRLGTHYAMMLDSEDDIQQIINNISKLEQIASIRIYNKQGVIKFSNNAAEVDETRGLQEEACEVCHQVEPPLSNLDTRQQTRVFTGPDGERLMGFMSPIHNEPGCWTDTCHVHPPDKTVLGLLDVVVSLEAADSIRASFKRNTVAMALLIFLATFAAIYYFVSRFVSRPVRKLMAGTRTIARGGAFSGVDVQQEDEMGKLARAINRMGREVSEKHAELNKQRNLYQDLFERVPCIITVVGRDFRLSSFNREFSSRFRAKVGDYCYKAWKGREEKCEDCPVERTFTDGLSHYSEETGLDKDGTVKHWIVNTSPIRDESGEITAAMEMCLDITRRKQLEERLEISERKYHAIFSNIPNAVFVLDVGDLSILDCNESVTAIYGYERSELLGRPFTDLFKAEERAAYLRDLKALPIINQATQVAKGGKTIFTTLRVSPSDYSGREVLLVTSSDITNRLEAEQQLIQASKMATLGEMATGLAHELNQPLSVIQTISGFFMRKIRRNQRMDDQTFEEMARGVSAHVERAAKIINHMREFGRKSEISLEPVRVNDVLKRAFDLFSQQLKLRRINVVWDLDKDLPEVMGEPNRLEQVFVNLLINARDAIEERWQGEAEPDKRILLTTRQENGRAVIRVCDTGPGIPEAIQEKLFEPFFTTKEVGKGTGLGLSISYGIVKDHGGVIRAEANVDGAGACFVIELPLPPAQ